MEDSLLLQKMDETISILKNIDEKLGNECGCQFAGTTAGEVHQLMPEPIGIISTDERIYAARKSYETILNLGFEIEFGNRFIVFTVICVGRNDYVIYISEGSNIDTVNHFKKTLGYNDSTKRVKDINRLLDYTVENAISIKYAK